MEFAIEMHRLHARHCALLVPLHVGLSVLPTAGGGRYSTSLENQTSALAEVSLKVHQFRAETSSAAEDHRLLQMQMEVPRRPRSSGPSDALADAEGKRRRHSTKI